MVGKPEKKKTRSSPLTRAEIRGALARSGYPFEIELLAALDSGGLDPTHGFRLRVSDGEARPMRSSGGEEDPSAVTREIDVMANVFVSKVVKLGPEGAGAGPRSTLMARLVAVGEAKSLPPSSAFVGFRYKEPPPGKSSYAESFRWRPIFWTPPRLR